MLAKKLIAEFIVKTVGFLAQPDNVDLKVLSPHYFQNKRANLPRFSGFGDIFSNSNGVFGIKAVFGSIWTVLQMPKTALPVEY